MSALCYHSRESRPVAVGGGAGIISACWCGSDDVDGAVRIIPLQSSRLFRQRTAVVVLAAAWITWVGILSPSVRAQSRATTVSAVRFEGNVHFSDATLAAEVALDVGGAVDVLVAREGQSSIIARYRDAGFGNIAVTFDPQGFMEAGELVYTIVEGARIRIRRIVFEGNTMFPDRELNRQIETKRAFWIFRTGAFDEEKVESDVLRLQAYYRDHGFLDARVGYRTEFTDDGANMTVVFTIGRGDRYTIESIDFSGQTVFTTEELAAVMSSRVGAVILRREVEADTRTLRGRYNELGYIYASVRVLRLFSDTPGLVRLAVEIDEGAQYRIGRVVVRGNTRTRDKVVRRALNLYPPEDLFDLTEARSAERRLLETRIFSSARVYPVGDAAGVRDAVIDVVEAEKAGDFIFGFGVTSNSGLVGNLVLDLQNFDWQDRPRSWSELFKLRSFFGGGQHLRLELQPGTELARFRMDFTEPYLGDRPVRFDLSAYLFERVREGYTEGRAGLSVSLGKRFQRGHWEGWSGEIALRVEDASVDDIYIFASGELRDDEGSNLLTSVKGALVRDRTDNRFVPTTGDRVRLSYEQFAGDYLFGRLTAGYTWFTTVHTDVFERKSVLQLRADGGIIFGDPPVIERFFAGGTGSIRGFKFRGVGERDGIDDTNIGGDFRVLLGAEYTYPLVGDNVRGVFYLDTGAVGSGTWRASVGAGVRFTLDFFGPVPLELGIAVPVSSDADDEQQVFHFMVGRIF